MEQILVVKTKELIKEPFFGIKKMPEVELRKTISDQGVFISRGHAEVNTSYKQVIPYLIYKYQDQVFLMQRSAQASERRLQNKYSLGIGGHVRKGDLESAGSLLDLAKREFHEEVEQAGNYHAQFLGLLNDDSNAVGRVHSGLIYLLEGDSKHIKVKTEMQSGFLVKLKDLHKFVDSMENWSKIATEHLLSIF